MMCTPEVHAPGAVDALCYELLLAPEQDQFAWPVFDENSAAFLCYTSGTTGDPKGALYSHRAWCCTRWGQASMPPSDSLPSTW
jgi:fatty-acyl-CoA synthase